MVIGEPSEGEPIRSSAIDKLLMETVLRIPNGETVIVMNQPDRQDPASSA